MIEKENNIRVVKTTTKGNKFQTPTKQDEET